MRCESEFLDDYGSNLPIHTWPGSKGVQKWCGAMSDGHIVRKEEDCKSSDLTRNFYQPRAAHTSKSPDMCVGPGILAFPVKNSTGCEDS